MTTASHVASNRMRLTPIEWLLIFSTLGMFLFFALPHYQLYSVHQQLEEGVRLSSGVKTAVIDSYAQGGYCVDNSDPLQAAVAGIMQDIGINGRFVAKVTTGGTSPHCTVTATFRAAGLEKDIQGATLVQTLSPHPEKPAWSCALINQAGVALPNRYWPRGCGAN